MANTEVLKEFIAKVKQLESEKEELKEYESKILNQEVWSNKKKLEKND